MLVAGALFVTLSAPVVIDGSPLADDYWICMRPVQDGAFWPYVGGMWEDGGVVRPARYLEYALISTCRLLPFSLLILVPLALKLLVAALLYALLRDLHVRQPWPAIGAAVWMLEPLGTEAALWPAALHVHLALALVLGALLLHRHGRLRWGTSAAIAACLALEQAIFVLPLAVWASGRIETRRRATTATLAGCALVLAAYATWPGRNPKNVMTLGDRLHGVFEDPSWYVQFPAAGLGFHSGPLGFLWAFPLSLAVVAITATLGALIVPRLLGDGTRAFPDRLRVSKGLAMTAALVVLTNIPLIVTQPVGLSARTFTPTWLVLCGVGALVGARVRWRNLRVVGVVAGTFVAYAVLSLALSTSVRVRTAAFDREAAQWLAARTDDGDVVAVCEVPRVVVDPAPVGSFHLHALHFEDGSWIQYHSGRVVEVRRGGEVYWGARCPNLEDADLVISFSQLLRNADADDRS